MGRLHNLPSRVGRLAPRLAKRTDTEGHSLDVEPLRHLYSTARWRALRKAVILRDDFTCQCGCGVYEPDSAKLVADHREPHRGDLDLFWDEDNLQTLRASPCHNAKKQREERRSRGRGV